MKVSEGDRTLTKRDLLAKLQKVEKANGTLAHRADVAEQRERSQALRIRTMVDAMAAAEVTLSTMKSLAEKTELPAEERLTAIADVCGYALDELEQASPVDLRL